MKFLSISFCFLTLCINQIFCIFGYRDIYKVEYVPLKPGEDPGEPLILTPYLEDGNIKAARELSEVPAEKLLGVRSYSGYFTVDKKHNSNSFFWFFPATERAIEDAPILLWLQGGPGGASIFATFQENGPFRAINETSIELSEITWTKDHSVLYIDNPVGTGFSFTNGRWCTCEEEIGEDLYNALIQFFTLFPELQENDFFITGESYAGKYIPAVSYTIHQKNKNSNLKINLKGLAIGNGLSDTVNQLNYGDYLYQLGLIDAAGRTEMEKVELDIIELIKAEDYDQAFVHFDLLLNGDLTKYPTVFKNLTGFDYYYNYLYTKEHTDSFYTYFLQQSEIRKALHVGNMSLVSDDEVETSLRADFCKSVAPWVSELLSHYRVLIYNGQLDIIVPYPLTVNYLKKLNFSAADEYKEAKRREWIVNGAIAGYVKEAGNLTEVLVRNAGHMVPSDQPEWALDLISKFVRGLKLN